MGRSGRARVLIAHFVIGRLGGGLRAHIAQIVRTLAVFQQLRDHRADFHAFAAFRHYQLADRAFVHGFDLHRRLVGLDLGQQVAGADAVALLDQPFG